MSDEQTMLTREAASEAPAQDAPAIDTPTATTGGDATAAPTTEPTSWVPESLKAEKWTEKYKSTEDALKAFGEAQKLLGKRAEGIVPPGEDAKPEEVEAFNAKLRELRGVPDSPEKYEVAAPEDAPEGYALDENIVGAFQKLAHEAGIAPAEFKRLADGYMQMEIAGITQARQQHREYVEKEEAALVKGWQDEGLQPKEMFTRATKAAQALGLLDKDGTTSLLSKHAQNHAPLLKALAENVYPLIAEGKLKGGAAPQTSEQYTPKEALEKGRAMMRDPRYSEPLKRDPEYVRQVEQFFEEHGAVIAKKNNPIR